MKSRKSLWAALALPFVLMAAVAIHPAPTPVPRTLEETASHNCAWKGSSVRDLVKTSQRTGLSTETVETWEFAVCVGQEKAVLEEEVRRGFRPAFAEKSQKKAQETELKMSCPPSEWMTANGCQKAISTGGLSR